MKKFKVKNALNGFTLIGPDGDIVYQHKLDANGDEIEGFASFLYAINDLYGPTTSRYSKKRIYIQVGTKKVGSGERKQSGFRAPRENPIYAKPNTTRNAPDNYGTETIAAWNCTPGCAVAMLDEQSGPCKTGSMKQTHTNTMGYGGSKGSEGGASRFFYCFKASKADKNAGTDLSNSKAVGARPNSGDATGKFPDHDQRERIGNFHPTVKSTKLMSYLIKLITPAGGTILDPFVGSGTTGVSAIKEGFTFIGIEKDPEYIKIAEARLSNADKESNGKSNSNQDDSAA